MRWKARGPRRRDAPDAVRRLGRHRLGAVEHGAGDLQRAEHLAQLLLDVQEAGDADRVGQLHRQAAEELHLAEHARRGLTLAERHRRAADLVGELAAARAAVDHDAVPGHEHVVEHGDAVHLLEAAAQRVVEAVVRAAAPPARGRSA